jgi:hypothetical protein
MSDKVELPDGFQNIAGFSEKWDYKTQPILEGTWGIVRTIQVVRGRKSEEARVVDVEQDNGESVAVWESAALKNAFLTLQPGNRVHIAYMGEGTARKPGQSPPHLFKVGYQA